MANINASNSTGVYQLKKWLGLNESPDGDTGLKLGEAAEMRNFRITREGHLQVRPGYAPKCTLAEGHTVRELWCGDIKGQNHLLAACDGKVWDVDPGDWSAMAVGDIDDGPTHFFGFDEKVYILAGSEYYCWDGENDVTAVEGYIPVVVSAASPEGGGTLLERVNLLTGKRRAKYSPDGTAKTFTLPEREVDEVLGVEGTNAAWTLDKAAGTVTFNTAPAEGTNTVVITYRKGNGERGRVTSMRFSELYNGDADSRVFLYGDGTYKAVYSDLDNNGQPTAEYFPDMNEMTVGEANTPITAMIRHYDRLMVYKSDSAYFTDYGTITLEDGTVTAAFYTTPLNREIGCGAPGQTLLVENNPRTLHGRAIYEWALVGNGARDERNARRISDRVESTLEEFAPAGCICFDDEHRQEYYVICGDEAVVNNYGNDTWYYYNNIPARCMGSVDGELYFGTSDGRLMHFSRQYRNDDLTPIDAYWESGALSFGQDWRRKYSANIWVSIQTESQARVLVTAQSNRKSEHAVKEVASGLSTFANVNFGHWSFNTNRKPQVQRVKLKVKKFTFYKLVISSNSASGTGTVLAADFQVRYTGNVK